jgi:hypothetical protein
MGFDLFNVKNNSGDFDEFYYNARGFQPVLSYPGTIHSASTSNWFSPLHIGFNPTTGSMSDKIDPNLYLGVVCAEGPR